MQSDKIAKREIKSGFMHEYRLKHSALASVKKGWLAESNNLSRKITGFKLPVNTRVSLCLLFVFDAHLLNNDQINLQEYLH